MHLKLQSAKAHFCAAHVNAEGSVHGHSYQAVAYWLDDGADVMPKARKLRAMCDALDHKPLPLHLTRGEDIAAWLGDAIGAIRVDVERPLEGLGGHWIAE